MTRLLTNILIEPRDISQDPLCNATPYWGEHYKRRNDRVLKLEKVVHPSHLEKWGYQEESPDKWKRACSISFSQALIDPNFDAVYATLATLKKFNQ